MFSINDEFEKLVETNWLSENEANIFSSDEKIINCINFCTSPSKENIFNSLKKVPFEKVKAVILGQDPYPNPNHAHGLAFSSRDNTTPESLKNIFRAIDSTYGSNLLNNAYNELTNWAEQGVLLLNTSLTFQKCESNLSDKKEQDKQQQILQKTHLKAWRPFINTIIKKIITTKTRPVAMFLWGNAAHDLVFKNIKNNEFQTNIHSRNAIIIPDSSVLLLQTSHPSPLSVNRGGDFLTTTPQHLKECDKHLVKNKIEWTKL